MNAYIVQHSSGVILAGFLLEDKAKEYIDKHLEFAAIIVKLKLDGSQPICGEVYNENFERQDGFCNK